MIRPHSVSFGLCNLLLLWGMTLACAAETRLALKLDPFAKPLLTVVEPSAYADKLDVAAEPIEIEPPPLPELRAILHSQQNTLVNLNGDLVAVGARYQGYRVAAVGARDVVLLDDDETYVISIDQKGDDDARLR